MSLLRRVRGVAVTAAMWGLAFGVTGALVGLVLEMTDLLSTNEGVPKLAVDFATIWGVAGTGAGAMFATALILTQRKRTLADLSARRFTVLGLAAGVVIPFAVSLFVVTYALGGSFTETVVISLVVAGICGAVGAGVATTTLRLARGATERTGVKRT